MCNESKCYWGKMRAAIWKIFNNLRASLDQWWIHFTFFGILFDEPNNLYPHLATDRHWQRKWILFISSSEDLHSRQKSLNGSLILSRNVMTRKRAHRGWDYVTTKSKKLVGTSTDEIVWVINLIALKQSISRYGSAIWFRYTIFWKWSLALARHSFKSRKHYCNCHRQKCLLKWKLVLLDELLTTPRA